MKKNLAELKAKSAERREKMRELSKRIAALSPEQRQAIANKNGVFTIAGRPLSTFNTVFILNQNERASVVGGFRQWKDAGRSVKKGESGLALWVPCSKKETAAPADAPEGTEAEGARPSYIIGYVFDITQTQEGTTNPTAETKDDENLDPIAAAWQGESVIDPEMNAEMKLA